MNAKPKFGKSAFLLIGALFFENSLFCQTFSYTDSSICMVNYWGNGVQYAVIRLEGTTVSGDNFNVIPYPSFQTYCFALPYSWDQIDQLRLTPVQDDNFLNGVSTYDRILIKRHITKVEPFNNPYQHLAADVNKSGFINGLDNIELMNLLLGIYVELPHNTSHIFVPATFNFPDPFNPLITPYPESITKDSLVKYSTYAFKAVKVGDINGTPYNLLPNSADTRASQMLNCPEMNLETGKVYQIPIMTSSDCNWYGCQLAIQSIPGNLEILEVIPGNLPELDINSFAVDKNHVVCSWAYEHTFAMQENEKLFEIRVRALKDAPLSASILLNNSRIKPEAYDYLDENPLPLGLNFISKTDRQLAGIGIPQPNPTTDAIQIPVVLASANAVELFVYDLTGRLVFQQKSWMEAGAAQITIPATALSQKGMYQYKIAAGELQRSGTLIKQ